MRRLDTDAIVSILNDTLHAGKPIAYKVENDKKFNTVIEVRSGGYQLVSNDDVLYEITRDFKHLDAGDYAYNHYLSQLVNELPSDNMTTILILVYLVIQEKFTQALFNLAESKDAVNW